MPRPKKEKPNHAGGLYEVKITTGKTLDGKLIRKSFYSRISKDDARRQAEEWKIEKEAAQRSNQIFVEKDITFDKWAKIWLETYKKGKVKNHTYEYTYRVNVEKYMIPYFASLKLKDITPTIIQKYFNEHSHLAESNLKRHRMILSNVFDQAINNDLCIKNPVRGVSYTSEKPPVPKRAYTFKESQKAQKYALEHNGGLGIYIMLNTGLRRSELLGLMWKDIDFKNKTVAVKRGVVPDTTFPKDGDVKSKTSQRIIPVSSDFINALKPLKQESGFVLVGTKEGSFLTIYAFDRRYQKFMHQMCNDTGLPYLSPHELRHTYGSVLREKGVDIYTISKVMGHSDISITAKIYVHNDIEVLRKSLKL